MEFAIIDDTGTTSASLRMLVPGLQIGDPAINQQFRSNDET